MSDCLKCAQPWIQGALGTLYPAVLLVKTVIVYDTQGYPHFSVDFVARSVQSAEQARLATLLIRSIFEDGGLGRVVSVDDVQPGIPAGGWTIQFTGETNGRTADPYIATYDGDEISYNDDPNRQSRDLTEHSSQIFDFASKKSGKGKKNCSSGRPCGGSCISRGKSCKVGAAKLSPIQQKAARKLAGGSGETLAANDYDPIKWKASKRGEAQQKIGEAEAALAKQESLVAELMKRRGQPGGPSFEDIMRERKKMVALTKSLASAIRQKTAATRSLRKEVTRQARQIKSKG